MVIPYHRIRIEEEMIKLREELESKENELKDVRDELVAAKLEYGNREKELIKKYEDRIEILDKKLSGKPKEKNVNSNENVGTRHLTYLPAIDLRDMIKNYAECPVGELKNVEDSVYNILKVNARSFLEGRTRKDEMEDIIRGLDAGKSYLYKNMTGGYTSEKKGLAKFVEDKEENLKKLILAKESGNVGFLDKLMLYL